MDPDSDVKTPTPTPRTQKQSRKRVPTLTEMELYSFSPERLEAGRRREVAEYMDEVFVQGGGNKRREEADRVIHEKITAFLASR
jgi:hypothetical protein